MTPHAHQWADHGHGWTAMEGSPGQKEPGVFICLKTNGHGAQGALCKAELLKLFHISIPQGRQNERSTLEAWGFSLKLTRKPEMYLPFLISSLKFTQISHFPQLIQLHLI